MCVRRSSLQGKDVLKHISKIQGTGKPVVLVPLRGKDMLKRPTIWQPPNKTFCFSPLTGKKYVETEYKAIEREAQILFQSPYGEGMC